MSAIQQMLMAAGWRQAYAWTADGQATGWANFTLRERIDTSRLLPGSQLRLTINNGVDALTLAACYVQIAASGAAGDYTFATTPVAVTWAGSASLSIAGGAGDRTSDPINLSITAGTPLIISGFVTTNNLSRLSVISGISTFFKAGNDAATVAATGYSVPSFNAYLWRKLEVSG
jgi:hypothetical protein